MSKNIHTTIPEKMWKKALLSELSWQECLILGIKMKLGNKDEISSLKKKMKEAKEECSNKVEFYQQKIDKIKKNKKAKEEKKKSIEKYNDLLQELTTNFLDPSKTGTITGYRNRWNNVTGLNMNHKEFIQLLKKKEKEMNKS